MFIFRDMARKVTKPTDPKQVMESIKPAGSDIEERIRQRAYELYVQRGRRPGHAEEDWRLAEEEIRGITGGG